MRTRTILRSMVTVVTMAVTLALTAMAAPKSPIEFDAKIVALPNAAPYVTVSWVAPKDGDEPTAYLVYMAEGETEDRTRFVVVDTVHADELVSDRGGLKFYATDIKDLERGVYTFFVTAINDDGESPRTKIKVLNLKPAEAKLVFISVPQRTGQVDKGYRYAAKVGGIPEDKKKDVRYSIVQGPDGMEIDPITGVIEWKPTEEGRYVVVIKAIVEGTDFVAEQEFVIEVVKKSDKPDEPRPDVCVKVMGRVTASDNNARTTGMITAWRVDVSDDREGKEKMRAIFRVPFTPNGYTMNIPAGTYKFVAEGPGIAAVWHENATNAEEATAVTVACNDQKTINFTVTVVPPPNTFEVTGTVTDEESGAPLRALVVFEARSGDKAGELRVVRAETREDGTYQVRLPEGVSYVASAKAVGRDNQANAYLMEFWEETGDATVATSIVVDAAREGINFTLSRRPVYANSVTGQVVSDSMPAGFAARVTAYRVRSNDDKPNDGKKEHYVTVESAASGAFTFENLEPGTYIFFAAPAERPTVPGWYVDGAPAAFSWKDATRVEVAETSSSTITISLRTSDGEGRGKGRIRGWVYRNGPSIGKGDDTQVSATVPGAVVVALDRSGAIVDWTMSASEGQFDMTSLGIGNVTVRADRYLFEPAMQMASVDAAAMSEQEINFSLLQSDVTSVDLPADRGAESYNLFPNPTTSAATVQFPATGGTATVTILSASGVVLSAFDTSVDNGLTRLSLSTEALPAGLYLVRIANGTSRFALPMSVVR